MTYGVSAVECSRMIRILTSGWCQQAGSWGAYLRIKHGLDASDGLRDWGLSILVQPAHIPIPIIDKHWKCGGGVVVDLAVDVGDGGEGSAGGVSATWIERVGRRQVDSGRDVAGWVREYGETWDNASVGKLNVTSLSLSNLGPTTPPAAACDPPLPDSISHSPYNITPHVTIPTAAALNAERCTATQARVPRHSEAVAWPAWNLPEEVIPIPRRHCHPRYVGYETRIPSIRVPHRLRYSPPAAIEQPEATQEDREGGADAIGWKRVTVWFAVNSTETARRWWVGSDSGDISNYTDCSEWQVVELLGLKKGSLSGGVAIEGPTIKSFIYFNVIFYTRHPLWRYTTCVQDQSRRGGEGLHRFGTHPLTFRQDPSPDREPAVGGRKMALPIFLILCAVLETDEPHQDFTHFTVDEVVDPSNRIRCLDISPRVLVGTKGVNIQLCCVFCIAERSRLIVLATIVSVIEPRIVFVIRAVEQSAASSTEMGSLLVRVGLRRDMVLVPVSGCLCLQRQGVLMLMLPLQLYQTTMKLGK
ncbi:hypothetical protein BD779DRAFT_1473693 [Infundibulicybe gibba]|nr:hypothetical protein BD779DRAFT_1473693 [Infundibulicybe gibba]